MKINPYSSSYTSSSTSNSKTSAAPASNRDAVAHRRESANNAPNVTPQRDIKAQRNDNTAQRHNFDRQTPPSSKSASAVTPASQYQATASSRDPINYYSQLETVNQVVDKQEFYIAPTDQVSTRESDYADRQRVNMRLNSHALASYRELQAMDEEQTQLQEHQWILGVDTYV